MTILRRALAIATAAQVLGWLIAPVVGSLVNGRLIP
jgi:hypothetical protein